MLFFVWILPLFIYLGIAAQTAGLILCCILAPLVLIIKYDGVNVPKQWLHISFFLFIIWAIFPLWNLLGLNHSPIVWKKVLSSHIPSSVIIASIGIFLINIVANHKNSFIDKTKFIYSPKDLFSSFINGFLCATILITIYLVIQHYTGFDYREVNYKLDESHQIRDLNYRVKGLYGHPLSISSVFIGIVFFFSYLYMNLENIKYFNLKHLKAKIFAITCMSYLNLVMSSGRFAIAIASVWILVCFLSKLRKVMNFSFLWKFVLALPFFVFFIIQSGVFQRIYQTFVGFEYLLHKIPRITIWKIHWQLFLDKPWLGYDSINFKIAREALYSSSGNLHLKGLAAHNIFLQTFCEIGILGALIVFVCLFFVFCNFKKVCNPRLLSHFLTSALGFSFLANVLHGLMQNTFYDTHAVVLYMALAFFVLWTSYFEKTYQNIKQRFAHTKIIF
jgi:O-antigen ligase